MNKLITSNLSTTAFSRRKFLTGVAGLTAVGGLGYLSACFAEPATTPAKGVHNSLPPLNKSAAEWREILTPEQFHILREEGTERSGSSPLDKEKRAGTFICAGCNLPLFSSSAKYNSFTGWPSFWQPIAASHVGTSRDFKLFFPRTEYHCARCGGHQGHIFDDGPQPTGLRYCNNGLALKFVPESQALPELLL